MFGFTVILLVFFLKTGFAQDTNQQEQVQEPKFVGQFFDIQVPEDNYFFIKSVLVVFGNRWGKQPTTPQELEGATWDQLVLSYEAFRRGINVNPDEIDVEIDKILQAEKVTFDRKDDFQAYEQWIKDKTNEPKGLFENQIRHLVQLEKLRQQVMDSITPAVNEQEAYREFVNEYNTLSVELREFRELKEAENFYKKAKANLKFWNEEKTKNPKDFRRPGLVSTEFLMDLWKFPKSAIDRMMKMKPGAMYPPAPIYKGYGVFKILEKRPANPDEFPKLRKSYYEQIRMKKKFSGLSEWFQNLKKQANIKIYNTKEEQK